MEFNPMYLKFISTHDQRKKELLNFFVLCLRIEPLYVAIFQVVNSFYVASGCHIGQRSSYYWMTWPNKSNSGHTSTFSIHMSIY